jgi:hypothetical protein
MQSKHPQQFVTRAFNSVVNSFDGDIEIDCRLCMGLPMEHLYPEALANFPGTFQLLSRASPQVRMCVLKTFMNAWTTSHRAHEQTLLTYIYMAV